jgi:hypothetical protein
MNASNFARALRGAVCLSAIAAASVASAHVGIANLTTGISVGGQSQFAIANTTNEVLFAIPHGCNPNAESSPAAGSTTAPALDTYKIAITIPAAVVTATGAASVRPVLDGTFGPVVRTTETDGGITFTWTRLATAGSPTADDQLYKASVRLKFPAATGTAITKVQFLTKQHCKANATWGGTAEVGSDVVLDWGTANSPTILVFPDKRRGFNSYTLSASTVGDFAAATGTATLASRLKGYFGDAAIVWVGKAGYSANTHTQARVTALIAKDGSYSDLGATAGKSLTANDTIWVRY